MTDSALIMVALAGPAEEVTESERKLLMEFLDRLRSGGELLDVERAEVRAVVAKTTLGRHAADLAGGPAPTG